MSEGKIAKINLSPEEIERQKVGALLSWQKKIDEQIIGIRSSIKGIEEFNEGLELYNSDIKEIKETIVKLFSFIHQQETLVNSKFSDQINLNDSIKKEFLSFIKENQCEKDSLKQDISNLNKDCSKLHSVFLSKNDFDIFNAKLNNENVELRTKLKDLERKLEFSKSNFIQINNTISFLQNEINDIKNEHEKVKLNIGKECESIRNGIQTQYNLSNSQRKTMDEKIENSIQNLKKELEGSPSIFEGAKAEFKLQLNSMALDVANSLLRASNVEQHLKIADRKIENIQQTLKKYEFEG